MGVNVLSYSEVGERGQYEPEAGDVDCRYDVLCIVETLHFDSRDADGQEEG